MKRILSLALALLLMLTAVSALAITPNFNGPFPFDYSTYKTIVDAFTATMDPPYAWEPEPLTTYGYDMYAMLNSDETAALTVHMVDGSGKVSALEIDVFIPVNRTTAEETKSGEEFGKLIGFGLLAAYYLENYTFPADIETRLQSDITPLIMYVNDLDSFSDAQIANGTVCKSGSVLGYPCAIKLDKVEIDGTMMFMISFSILPTSGSFSD